MVDPHQIKHIWKHPFLIFAYFCCILIIICFFAIKYSDEIKVFFNQFFGLHISKIKVICITIIIIIIIFAVSAIICVDRICKQKEINEAISSLIKTIGKNNSKIKIDIINKRNHKQYIIEANDNNSKGNNKRDLSKNKIVKYKKYIK